MKSPCGSKIHSSPRTFEHTFYYLQILIFHPIILSRGGSAFQREDERRDGTSGRVVGKIRGRNTSMSVPPAGQQFVSSGTSKLY